MVDISLINLDKVLSSIVSLPNVLNAALTTQSQQLATTLVQNVQDGKLSGEALQEKTGLLKSSIESTVEASSDGVNASVFVSGDVPYAAIQEYGGSTKAHIIEAAQGKALSFAFAGKQAFFAHVNHPGSIIPEHSYLRSALSDMQDDIVSGFSDALSESIPS